MPQPTLIRAQPRKAAQKLLAAVVILLVLTGAGQLVIAHFNEVYRDYEKSPDPAVLARLGKQFIGMLMIMWAGTAAAAAGLIWHGIRVIQLRQIPLPNATLLRDTMTLVDDAAVLRGWGIIIAGAALFVCVSLVLYYILAAMWPKIL